MKEITQTTKSPVFFKPVLMSVLLVSAFLVGGEKAQAEQAVVFYSNPQGGACENVDATYTLTQAEIAAGYTIQEVCTSYVQEGDCSGYTYQKCTAQYNADSTEAGAVASFAAAMNKVTYTPGETGWVSMIGSLGSYPGSEFANAVLFFTPNIALLRNIVCWFLSCPVTRRVDMSATIPSYSHLDPDINPIDECGYFDQFLGDSFGFTRIATGYNSERQCQNSWREYFPTFSQGAVGSISGANYFKAPLTPRAYTVDLVGCHEKFAWSCGRATLNFEVVAAPAPNVNLNFTNP